MNDKLNQVDAQKLIVKLLDCMENDAFFALVRKIEADEKLDDQHKEYIFACISFVVTVKNKPSYCSTFDLACKAVIARQKGVREETVLKKEYLGVMGWSNMVQIGRIEKGTAVIGIERIASLCNGFQKKSDRIFWENFLLSMSPTTCYPIYSENCAYDALDYIIKLFKEDQYENYTIKLTDEEKEKMLHLTDMISFRKSSERLGNPPYRLYPTVKNLVKQTDSMTIEKLVTEELLSTMQTWYSWKTTWENAEKNDFSYVPSPRIPREYLIVIAMVFKLNYSEMITLLQIGGYRLGLSERDKKIAEFFLYGNSDREELKRLLLNPKM